MVIIMKDARIAENKKILETKEDLENAGFKFHCILSDTTDLYVNQADDRAIYSRRAEKVVYVFNTIRR